jgi:formate dehydrogenase subunit gamma
MESALTPEQHAAILRIVDRDRARPGNLIEILHAVQDEIGFVPASAVPLIATELNLSRAEVHGVVTFYHHFRHAPPGRHTVQLCQAESCQSMGADALAAHAKVRLGIDFKQTTPDGRFTLEPVYCLGNCACSPALMIDGELHGRVTAQRFDEIVADQTP